MSGSPLAQRAAPPRRSDMAKPPTKPTSTKVPPRSKNGGGSRPTSRPVPPRPPRKPPRRGRGGRSQVRFYALLVAAVAAIVALVVIVVVVTGGGSSGSSKQPINAKTAAGVPIYGKLGPEKMPLQVGTPLAAANT